MNYIINRFRLIQIILLVCLIILNIIFIKHLNASDWPVYKGNIYYTGNNDEITVKNNNLKWLFQASHLVYNPIISDSRVYFLDLKKILYCVNEENGKLLWKVDLQKISSQFSAHSRAFGKIKYPLIKGNMLFITDNIAIYCFDKRNGKILWARTGMRDERKLDNVKKWKPGKSSRWQPGKRKSWAPSKSSTAIVDGIYSDPVIHNNSMYYGTRNIFISREIDRGHLKWANENIKTYSGFPTFYDKYIFTQSMDYKKNRFTLNCIEADTGKIKWSNIIEKPMKIFSPVVYKRKVYLASGKSIYCFRLGSGAGVWNREYPDYITSNPSFTEREILFTLGNRSLLIINPENGSITKKLDFGRRSSPYFVTIRDQIYIANTFKKRVGKRKLSYASLKALRFSNKKKLWEYIPPFPGSAFQPAASKGIMFLPAGNYLYAVGTDYYPRIIKGGSAYYDPYNRIDPGDKHEKTEKKIKPPEKKKKKSKKIILRRMKLSIGDKNNTSVSSIAEITKWDNGKIVYSKKVRITKPGQMIDVPDSDNVEITAEADGYIPKKVIISKKDNNRKITLDRIEKGKALVVDNIYFEINEAYLKKESLNILDKMIKAMKQNKKIKIEVRGHTDSTGTGKHNKKLSGRRADSVIEYMIKNGISPERLKSMGFGESSPIASNKSRKGRRKNRRTEFYILDK